MTFSPANVTLDDPVYLHSLSENALGLQYHGMRAGIPTSGAVAATNRVHYVPFYLTEPYSLARYFWLNGATVGTDFVQVGIYDTSFTLLRASPRTLSAGTVNQVQYANPGIHATFGAQQALSSDLAAYNTSTSVTLTPGVMCLVIVENSHASDAAVVTSIDSVTAGYPTFTSRSTTQFNSNLNRVSIWSATVTSQWTGNLRANFGAAQTGCVMTAIPIYHVDTTTNDGIVQNAVGTGSSVTPLATLSAFGSSANATLGAFGQAANANGAPESAAYLELMDATAATPAQSLQVHFRPDNDTTVSETITSAPWGACAVEIKSLGTGAVWLPAGRFYMAFTCTGTTATFFRKTAWTQVAGTYLQSGSAAVGLPPLGVPATFTGSAQVQVFGFTRRSSP